jgi:hypothetical protein
MKCVLSLCDASGVWSAPYLRAGYEVVRVDLADTGHDVRLLKPPPFKVHGILAAPPCTVFSRAGQWVHRSDEEWIEALGIVSSCLRLVFACEPAFWALENPARGRLSEFLGRPRLEFEPCDFGDPWTKRTALWGKFEIPMPLFTGVHSASPSLGDITTRLSGSNKSGRSRTPAGFAEAFYRANP